MSTRIIRRITGLVLAVGIGVLWTPSPANANMRLELYDNSSNVGIVLTDIGNTGVLTFIGAVGAFTVNVTTGISQPGSVSGSPPAGEIAMLDLNSVNAASSTGGTLTILLENNNYSGTGTLTDVSSIGGAQTAGSSMTATSAVYANNSVPTLPTDGSTNTVPPALGGTTVFSLTSSSTTFSGSGSVNFTPTAGLFGLAKMFVINVVPRGTFSADFQNDVTAVPDRKSVV